MEIVIVGCGYVGLALGRLLVDRGHTVTGVRRSADGLATIEAAGLSPVEADVTHLDEVEKLPGADVVVYTASPTARGPAAARRTYVDGVRTVVEGFGNRREPPDRFIYTSSTGVYGDHDGAWVTETTPIDPLGERGRILARAERAAQSAPMDWTVIRLAGLYGPDRYRIDRLLERPVTPGYRNLIHRDDAAGIIAHLIETDRCRNEQLLGVDAKPVPAPDLVAWLAEQLHVEPPPTISLAERLDDPSLSPTARHRIAADKRCCNEKLVRTGYEYDFPTFREGYRPAIEARS